LTAGEKEDVNNASSASSSSSSTSAANFRDTSFDFAVFGVGGEAMALNVDKNGA